MKVSNVNPNTEAVVPGVVLAPAVASAPTAVQVAVVSEYKQQIADLVALIQKNDSEIKSLQAWIVNVDQKVANVDQKVANVDQKIMNVDQKVANVDQKVANIDPDICYKVRSLGWQVQVLQGMSK
ncbi:MAG: hypothetical protein K2L13_03835 [Opitutales bacterium]|nr:hypothetical protein [Opitutales bacterium]